MLAVAVALAGAAPTPTKTPVWMARIPARIADIKRFERVFMRCSKNFIAKN